MNTTEALIFESRDTEIFSIPDTKTKLNTLQNYFFPRLKRLLDEALLQVKEAYQIDPFERYNFTLTVSATPIIFYKMTVAVWVIKNGRY